MTEGYETHTSRKAGKYKGKVNPQILENWKESCFRRTLRRYH